ncbi:MAG: hypothetical protein ACXWB9_09730 [Flavisolibacter sp.]
MIEFASLPEELQYEVLHKHGVYIGKRRFDDQVALLFQLHGFYVELFYSQYRKSIEHVITSEHTDILQPYLDQVYIRDLIDHTR